MGLAQEDGLKRLARLTRVPSYRRFLDMPHAEAAGLYGREHPALFNAERPRA